MRNKTILLVEDTADDETLILMSLRKSGVANQIDVARDGQQALDYLLNDARKKLPAVVLLDLKLPKVDGLEVLQKLRAQERTKLLPVVVLTSSDEQKDRVESYGFGANSYVRKPIDFKEFADAVNQLGLYWLLLNQPARD